MATPTIPAVVPPAAEATPATPTGPLASILAGVQPARPVQPIGSTASMAEESIGAETGGRAAKGTTGGAQEGHWAALVRAIAARIGRTGTTQNIKRQHTITESRMAGNQVNTANRINRDTKQHQIGQHQTARDSKVNDNQSKIQQSSGRNHHDDRTSNSNAATQNGATRNGRDVKDHRNTQASGTTTSKQDAVVHKTHRDGLDPRPGKPTEGKTADAKTADPKPTKPGVPARDADTSTSSKKPDTAKTAPLGKAPADKPQTTAEEAPATKTRPRTQPSREAGYRDGERAGTVANHVKAYRDGIQDGYGDKTAEYKAEKQLMDDAKAHNAIKPNPPAKPQMAPASGTTAGMAKQPARAPADAKPAVPVQLTGISDTHVSFDADGASHTLSRGEVRTLKGFERRMATKRPVMRRVAENSKTTRAVAAAHATRALQLAERAKTVEGGDGLVAKLQSLAEKARVLSGKTVEIEKAAHRGAEAVQVLIANANTRHGGIYQAVVDSPLTKPAEREFYQDTEGS